MIRLFDGNILVAMAIPEHPHHVRTHRWLAEIATDPFATCATTEGTLLRLHMQFAADSSASAAWGFLATLNEHPSHVFWPEGFSYTEVDPSRLTGFRQITDAWLVELARRKGAKLATLDAALAVLHPETVELVPV